MRQPVNKRVVDIVASMLTDDPDILVEAESRPQHSKQRQNSGETGTYEAEEVPLDRTTLGSVVYDYEVYVSGGRSIARNAPPEKPDIEIGKILNMDVVGYDDSGEEIQPSPEQLKIWTKSAVDFFHSELESKVIRLEHEKLLDSGYDGRDDQEPDEDKLDAWRTKHRSRVNNPRMGNY